MYISTSIRGMQGTFCSAVYFERIFGFDNVNWLQLFEILNKNLHHSYTYIEFVNPNIV